MLVCVYYNHISVVSYQSKMQRYTSKLYVLELRLDTQLSIHSQLPGFLQSQLLLHTVCSIRKYMHCKILRIVLDI